VHLSTFTYLGFSLTTAVKSGAFPLISITSLYVRVLTSEWLKQAVIFGASMQAEQSFVGKVLSS
jgi:hypothetical protein